MLTIDRLKKLEDESDMAKWTTPDRLYLSEDGDVVDEAAPGRKTLLAPAGSQVSDEVCRRHGLGPYAEQPGPAEDATDPEAAGSCCPHPFKHHRKRDGACSYRKSCGCQGWQIESSGDPEDGDSGQDPGEADSSPDDGDGDGDQDSGEADSFSDDGDGDEG